MPLIEEDGFSKLLKNGTDRNIFFIFGDDSYLKDFYCEKLIRKTVDENMKMFNFHIYQDKETDLETIFSDAENLPMMADKTCLLIRNYPLKELSKDALEAFEKNLADIPATTVMIFFYNTEEISYSPKTSSKWNPVIEIFIRQGTAVRLDHRSPAKTAKMLVAKAGDRGTSIDPKEAEYFVECVGDDIQTIINEFNKVCAYSGGEKITREMIDETAVKTIEANVFEISASIFSGNIDRAFAIMNELLREKEELKKIIGAIASSYVNIYRYKVALNAGKGYSDFTEEFGYTGNIPRTFEKISAFTRKISISAIRRSIDILAETDVRSKSTNTDDHILMTEMIAKLASCVN